MAVAGSLSGGVSCLSDLRIVLLGNREAGKSSAGNIILGREEFDPDMRTLQCVKRQGEVAGRQLTVLDTPGWRDFHFALKKDSPILLKQEIVLSVTLCPPGPHAFLLVIDENMTFTEMERNATANHLSLLGHGAWKHSLVLFVQETPAEEKDFEVKGKMLQWLVEKCGNRYHVLNINSKDNTQVIQLLEKIEEMVAGNSPAHYEIDRRILADTEEKRRKDEKKGQERWRETQRKRERLNIPKGQLILPEIRIVLLGYKGAGKSSSGNTILCQEEFQPGQRSAVCVKRQGEVAGRQITVVEAPGWFRYCSAKYSIEFLKREIVLSQGLCKDAPHCFLLVIRVDARFTERKKTSVQQHLALLGSKVWDHTMVLFTNGDWLGDTTIDQFIESEGEHLQWVVKRCRNRYHVFNNCTGSDSTQTKELLQKIEEMVMEVSSPVLDRQLLCKLLKKKALEEERARNRMKKQKTMKHAERAEEQHLTSLGIVLLGCKDAGKTSVVNTILGQDFELYKGSRSLITEGELDDRPITVVEAPGWWSSQHLKDTPELIKQDIMLSVSQFSPRPYAVFLVIHASTSFTRHMRIAAEEHMELLGKEVWRHTMALFTYGDWLGDTTIEEYIESEEHLQILLEKCDNRYHVFNNLSRRDCTQVTCLLEKIEEMVLGDQPFELERQYFHNLQTGKKRKENKARGRDRMEKVQSLRKDLQSLSGISSPEPLRVVLLGHRYAGKSSSGDTILGKEEFDLKRTAQCVKRQGEVAGRHIAVVKGPGWSKDTKFRDTPEFIKQEIMHSMSLCHPGPHAVLLVINVTHSFNKASKMDIQQHVELLGKRVWDHTQVLFTSGDYLGDRTIEQYIEGEGEPLKQVVAKCGNRYHVFNNQNRGDDVQVTELLEKIQEMVAENKVCYHKMTKSHDMERTERQKKGQDRQMKIYKDDATLKFVLGDIPQLQEIRLVLHGYRRAGKSSSGNTILGREDFGLQGMSRCVKREGEVEERKVIVVEAPGWKKNQHVEHTYWLIKQQIVRSVSLCHPGPHALLLVIRIESSLTKEQSRVIQEHLQLLGRNVWKHTLIVFTYEDWLGETTIEQYIESEEHLSNLVEKCQNIYHVLNNKDTSDRTQVAKLLEKIEMIVARNLGGTLITKKETIRTQQHGKVVSERGCSSEVREHMEEKEMAESITSRPNFCDGDTKDNALTSDQSSQSSYTPASTQSSGYGSSTSCTKKPRRKESRKSLRSELATKHLAEMELEHTRSKRDPNE